MAPHTPLRERLRLHDPRLTLLGEERRQSYPWAWMAGGTLLAGLLFRHHLLTLCGVLLTVFFGVAWLWSALSLAGLSYERRFRIPEGGDIAPGEAARAFQGEDMELTLILHNRKPLPLNWLALVDIFPLALPLEGGKVQRNSVTYKGELRNLWLPGAYQRLTRRLVLHCEQRGYYLFGPAQLTSGDGFGLFTRQATMGTVQQLIVYPRLHTLTELGLPAKMPFGERASRQKLFEDPLRNAGIRDWQAADGLRRVHWKATARQQRMLSRVYEPSEEAQIHLFLNVATLERHWEGVRAEALEQAIRVTASLAAWCVEQRMSVGIGANAYFPGSDQLIRLLPGRSRNQLMLILELLAAVGPYASRGLEQELLAEAPRLPWGATLVVITTLLPLPLLEALGNLARAGRKVVVVALTAAPPPEMPPGILVHHLPQWSGDAAHEATP